LILRPQKILRDTVINKIPGEDFLSAFGAVNIKFGMDRSLLQSSAPVALPGMNGQQNLSYPPVPKRKQRLNQVPFWKIMGDMDQEFPAQNLFDPADFLADDADVFQGMPLKGCGRLGNKLIDTEDQSLEWFFPGATLKGIVPDSSGEMNDGLDIL
jgi:hypothetical protein